MYTIKAIKVDGTKVLFATRYDEYHRAKRKATELQELLMADHNTIDAEAVIIEKDGVECDRYDVQ